MKTSPFWVYHHALENELAKERKRRLQIGLTASAIVGAGIVAFYFLFR